MTPPDGNPTTRARGKLIGSVDQMAHIAVPSCTCSMFRWAPSSSRCARSWRSRPSAVRGAWPRSASSAATSPTSCRSSSSRSSSRPPLRPVAAGDLASGDWLVRGPGLGDAVRASSWSSAGDCAPAAASTRRSTEALGPGWREEHRPRLRVRHRAAAPAVDADPVHAVAVPAPRRRAGGRTSRYGDDGNQQPARRLPPPLAPHRRARRSSTSTAAASAGGQQEPRGAAAPLPAGQPGLDVHQRQLPPRPTPGAGFPRPPRSTSRRVIAWAREHGHELRRRSRRPSSSPAALPARTSPRWPRSPRTTRRSSPASRTADTVGHRGHRPLRLLRPARRRRPSRRPLRHAYVDADAPPFFVVHGDQRHATRPSSGARALRRSPARASSRNPVVLRRAPRWPALLRHVPLHPFRDGRRRRRGVHRTGAIPTRCSPAVAWRWWPCVSWSSSTGRRSARAATPASPHEGTSRRESPHSGWAEREQPPGFWTSPMRRVLQTATPIAAEARPLRQRPMCDCESG